VVIDGDRAGHYFLEDARGVRVADAHNAPGQTLALVRPGPAVPVYLRRADEEAEYLLDPEPELLALADLSEQEPRARARGAAHESFSLVFSLPFDRQAVATYRPAPPPEAVPDSPHAGSRLRQTLGIVSLGAAGVAVVGGVAFALAARATSAGGSPDESQEGAAARNGRIATYNGGAALSFVAGGALAVTGAALLLWPGAPEGVGVSSLPGGGELGYRTTF
jgi:hypothetical protein